MTDLPSLCKYGCKTMLHGWDNDLRKFTEENGTIHTLERCKEQKAKNTGGSQKEISPSGKSDHYGEFEAKRQVILKAIDQLRKQVEGL